ncbi:unnamed protein product [Fusarium graminearum]|nr:unnamed protein product [Fusarium graminearum]
MPGFWRKRLTNSMVSISEGGTVLYPWSYVSSSSRSNNNDRFLSRYKRSMASNTTKNIKKHNQILVTKIPWSELYMIVVTLARYDRRPLPVPARLVAKTQGLEAIQTKLLSHS